MKKNIAALIFSFICIILCDFAFALEPPTWLVSLGTQNEVLLTWQMPDGAIKTIIYKKREGEEEFGVISQDALGFFMDKGVPEGIFVYKLQVVDSENNKSNYSDERYVIVEEAPEDEAAGPYAPPKWTESFSTENRILLRWEDTSDEPIRGYNLYKKTEDDPDYKLYQSITNPYFRDASVSLGQHISYKVCPLDVSLRELECSLPIDFVVKRPELPPDKDVPQFIVRKTRFDKFIKLPQNKKFISPTDIKVDKTGRIYVADTGSRLIHIFEYSGKYEKSIGKVIKDDGTSDSFENLLGIDVDKRGIIYAVDAYKGVLKAFNQEGVLILKKEMSKVLADQKKYNFVKFGLVDVSVDNKNKFIYVVDNFNSRVYKLDLKGNLKNVLFTKGQKPGQIHLPTFSYIEDSGNIILADTMNQRIAIFNSDAEPQMVFGKEGDVLGTFIRPKGIAKDMEGNIYIADSYTNCIQVFSPDGGFKYLIGNRRGKQLDIVTPNGIFVDNNNKIYVVEKLISRVQVRQLTDDYITVEQQKEIKE